MAFVVCVALAQAGDAAAPEEFVRYQQARDRRLRAEFSPLALVHREYLPAHGQVSIGSGAQAKIRLAGEGVAPLHALIEMDGTTPVLTPVGKAEVFRVEGPKELVTQLPFDQDVVAFRIGSYSLLYKLHESWGHIIEVYDRSLPRYRDFSGMEFFSYDPAYKVTATVVPSAAPEKIDLIDSHGSPRPVWIYGMLKFKLQGIDCALELYSDSTDPKTVAEEGFMLIFADATSGKETYPAARYLGVDGTAEGPLPVDFNFAYSPPCSFSPVWTCPFPRPQNRLPVAVQAGEKWYHIEDAAE